MIIKWCVVILALSGVAAVCARCAGTPRSTARTAPSTCSARELFAHLQQLHFGYHDRSQIGNLMARANLDLRQINNLIVFTPVLAANFVMVIGILVVLFTIDVKLTLVSVISFPLLAIAAVWFQKLLTPVATRLQERLADVSDHGGGRRGRRARGQGPRRGAGGDRSARRKRRAVRGEAMRSGGCAPTSTRCSTCCRWSRW